LRLFGGPIESAIVSCRNYELQCYRQGLHAATCTIAEPSAVLGAGIKVRITPDLRSTEP
jgi:hypothetical protein